MKLLGQFCLNFYVHPLTYVLKNRLILYLYQCRENTFFWICFIIVNLMHFYYTWYPKLNSSLLFQIFISNCWLLLMTWCVLKSRDWLKIYGHWYILHSYHTPFRSYLNHLGLTLPHRILMPCSNVCSYILVMICYLIEKGFVEIPSRPYFKFSFNIWELPWQLYRFWK